MIKQFDKAFENFQDKQIAHWNHVAKLLESQDNWKCFYHKRLTKIYKFMIVPGQRVLEVGCATGELLAAVKPSYGVGIDFSAEMIKCAKQKHPHLQFICADAHTLSLEEKFDVIILSDLINGVWNVQTVFERLTPLTTPHTRLIINSYSHLWEQHMLFTKWLSMNYLPNIPHNWLTVDNITNLLYLTDFEIIQHRQEVLWPWRTPLLAQFFNHYLVKIWPFRKLALTHFLIARARTQRQPLSQEPLVSVIVPARNEAGHIPQIVERIPEMGRGTEIIFVEGHSTDDTYEVIKQTIAAHPERRCQLLQQTGKGKGDAVRLGFAHASGEILMILDADLTVPPEELPQFYQALRTGKGEFINGVRLVYPMEQQAMRFMNLVGNKFFSLAFSWLLGQPIKDTLCGTKVLWKTDYEKIAANRNYFGEFDPFGDFDLIFGANKLNLKIVDLPIRYRERTYGTTNIQRWKHGMLLLKMVWFAARRIKFI
jgi:ubiquinone/menaquinone biosynthesis C-methylase UbiE